MVSLGEKMRKYCEERGIPVQTITVDIRHYYSHWSKRAKKQFRNALRAHEYPYGGHYISEGQLPRNHPARTQGYNHTDITSAFLEVFDEAQRKTARSNLKVG